MFGETKARSPNAAAHDSQPTSSLNRDSSDQPGPGAAAEGVSNLNSLTSDYLDMPETLRKPPGPRTLTAFGVTKRIFEWASDPRCLVSYQTLYHRTVRAGWSHELAIQTPRWGASRPRIVTSTPRSDQELQ